MSATVHGASSAADRHLSPPRRHRHKRGSVVGVEQEEEAYHTEGNQRYTICNGRRFVQRKAVNLKPATKEKHLQKYTFKHINVKDSGIAGRVFKHIISGSLILVIAEMGAYIFLTNIVFATLYWFCGGCCSEAEGFWDDFNFAFQTFSTIGYGELSPRGVPVNIIVFFQGIHSIVLTTIFAGVVFTKFIRPRWKFAFSDVMVVHNVRNVPTLEFRFVNLDGEFNDLTNAAASVYLSRNEFDPDGTKFHPTYALELTTDTRYSVRGVWTLKHRITRDTPLFGHTHEDLVGSLTHIHVSVTGTDPITEETVNKQAAYFAADILFGYKFVDQITFDKENDILQFDNSNLNEVVPAIVHYPEKSSGAMNMEGVEMKVEDEHYIEDLSPTSKAAMDRAKKTLAIWKRKRITKIRGKRQDAKIERPDTNSSTSLLKNNNGKGYGTSMK